MIKTSIAGLTPTLLLSWVLCVSLISSSYAQSQACDSVTFSNSVQPFQFCSNLPVLSSSIHWTRNANNSVDVAFVCSGVTAAKWCAWGVNFRGRQMVNTQALVGFVNSNGSAQAHTSPIESTSPTLSRGNLSFPVSNVRSELANGGLVIFARLDLPASSLSTMTQVWQVGDMGDNGVFQAHPISGPNVQSVSTWDLGSATATPAGVIPRLTRKNTHGVLNAVSWGILMPMGAIIARYLKVSRAADPAWFYLHVTCQTSAYIVGVAGWATGIKLGSDSSGVKYNPHRNIGITLFCLGTLQVFALLLRPKKDHKYRLYWNIYHHSVGYTVIILSIINIYKGFDILEPEKKWKRAYTGIIIALGAVAAVLEAFTWVVVLKRKKTEDDKSHRGANGVNGL